MKSFEHIDRFGSKHVNISCTQNATRATHHIIMWYHVYVSWICSHLTFCEKKNMAVERCCRVWTASGDSARFCVEKKKVWRLQRILRRTWDSFVSRHRETPERVGPVLPPGFTDHRFAPEPATTIQETNRRKQIGKSHGMSIRIMTSPFLSHPCEGNCNLLDTARLELL